MQAYVDEFRELVEQSAPVLNNKQRFLRAQFQDDLVIPRYEQDAWLRFNDARTRRGPRSWRTFNLYLGRVMAAVPQPVRTRIAEDLERGAIVIIRDDRLRIRRLS